MPRLKRTEVDEPFLERLRAVVRGAPSVSRLAVDIDRTEGAIRNWMEGRSQPNATDIILVCRATGTRAGWLMVGDEPRSTNDSLPKSYDLLDEKFLAAVVMVEEQAELLGLVLDPIRKGECLMEVYRALLSEPTKVTPKFVANMIRAFTS